MTPALSQPYDAIVVGAGHNGLAAAAYLAKEGLKVLVLERRDVVGGMCATEDVYPPFRFDTGAFTPLHFDEGIISDLDLYRYGLEFTPSSGVLYTCAFPDGRHFTIYDDLEKTCRELERFSVGDAAAYRRLTEYSRRYKRTVGGLVTTPPQTLVEPLRALREARGLGWLPALWKARAPLKTLRGVEGGVALEDFVSILFKPMRDTLEENFESEQVRAGLAWLSLLSSTRSPAASPTMILLDWMAFSFRTVRVKGGMGRIPEAMAKSVEARGGRVATGASVKRIIVREGAARGVELASGERLEARVVLSNADPKTTFLNLVGAERLPEGFVKRIEGWRCNAFVSRLNYALDSAPRFPFPSEALASWVGVCPNLDELEEAFAEYRAGRVPEHLSLLFDVPTYLDSSVAPPGKHILQMVVNPTPYRLREGSWEEMRDALGEKVTDMAEQYAPNLRSSTLHRWVLTPLDIETRFGSTGGDVYHGEKALDQWWAFRPALGHSDGRTPVRSLYLCGSGIHPGGGVTGYPGYNASRAVLEDWRAGRTR